MFNWHSKSNRQNHPWATTRVQDQAEESRRRTDDLVSDAAPQRFVARDATPVHRDGNIRACRF